MLAVRAAPEESPAACWRCCCSSEEDRRRFCWLATLVKVAFWKVTGDVGGVGSTTGNSRYDCRDCRDKPLLWVEEKLLLTGETRPSMLAAGV